MERAAFQCLQIFAAPVMKFCLSFCFAYNNFAVTLIQNEILNVYCTKMINLITTLKRQLSLLKIIEVIGIINGVVISNILNSSILIMNDL